jgi:hypothetical protein
VVGLAFDAYYARMVGARVAVQIPEGGEFCDLTAKELGELMDVLTRVGVTAIVATNRPQYCTVEGWRDCESRGSGPVQHPASTEGAGERKPEAALIHKRKSKLALSAAPRRRFLLALAATPKKRFSHDIPYFTT